MRKVGLPVSSLGGRADEVTVTVEGLEWKKMALCRERLDHLKTMALSPSMAGFPFAGHAGDGGSGIRWEPARAGL